MNRSHKVLFTLGGIATVVLLTLSIVMLARLELGAFIGYAEAETKRLGIKMLLASVALMFTLTLWGLRLMLKDSLKDAAKDSVEQ